MEPLKRKGIRQSNLEVLRIVSMLLIILYHLSRNIRVDNEVQKLIVECFTSWGILGVDCFVFISAWFLGEQKFRAEKIAKLISSMVIYSVIFLLIKLILIGDIRAILVYLLKTEGSAIMQPLWYDRYWFISAYILLYLCIPFIDEILKRIDHNMHRKLVLVMTIIPVYGSMGNGSGAVVDLAYYIYMYVLIAYLKKNKENFFEKNALLGAISCIILVIIGQLLRSTEVHIAIISSRTIANTTRHSGIMLITALFMFYFFLNLDIGSISWVNKIAGLTLGVYLFHENELINMCDILYSAFNRFNIPIILYMGMITLVIFVLGCLVEYIIQTMVMKRISKFLHKSNQLRKVDEIFMFDKAAV